MYSTVMLGISLLWGQGVQWVIYFGVREYSGQSTVVSGSRGVNMHSM